MRNKLLLALMLLSPAAIGGTVLNPVTLTGSPGQTVGWGFDMTPDPVFYLSVSAAFIDSESNPALGVFSDFISLSGGPVGGVLAPGSPNWTESYDSAALKGFGEYFIDSNAVPGDTNLGQFLVILLRYSGDPNSCGSCFVDSQFALVDFGVNVSEPVPEPASGAAAGIFAALLIGRYRTSRRCSASQVRTNVQRR